MESSELKKREKPNFMVRFLKSLVYFITWIALPPVYAVLIYYDGRKSKKRKIYSWLSIILSPSIYVAGIFIYIFFSTYYFPVSKMERRVGIDIPLFHWETKDDLETFGTFGQDFTIDREMVFTDGGVEDLVEDIKESTHYNWGYGLDTWEDWRVIGKEEKDSVFDDLYDASITGVWRMKDSTTYEFYEPGFSDIPNSSLIFKEGGFTVKAELNTETNRMKFRYVKF